MYESPASESVTGTSLSASFNAFTPMADFSLSEVCMYSLILAVAVSLPTFSAQIFILPSSTTVPLITRSPLAFGIGSASPVIET